MFTKRSTVVTAFVTVTVLAFGFGILLTSCGGIPCENLNAMMGDPLSNVHTTCGVGACKAEGFFACGEDNQVMEVCVPGIPKPQGEDVCDGIDNDCDGVVDNNGCDTTPPPASVIVWLGSYSQNGAASPSHALVAMKFKMLTRQGMETQVDSVSFKVYSSCLRDGGEASLYKDSLNMPPTDTLQLAQSADQTYTVKLEYPIYVATGYMEHDGLLVLDASACRTEDYLIPYITDVWDENGNSVAAHDGPYGTVLKGSDLFF